MTSDFAGATARHYRRFRRDVPQSVVNHVVRTLELSAADRVIDLGCGTGQVAVAIAPHVGEVIAVDPEPDMLTQLADRLRADNVPNVVLAEGADKDLVRVANTVGGGIAAVTIGNALHWMDAAAVFGDTYGVLRRGGGIVIITQGPPMWLAKAAWARDLRRYLERWTGSAASACGTDRGALEARRTLLERFGFVDIQIFTQSHGHLVDADYVVGHVYSAMSAGQVPDSAKAPFELGLREVLSSHEATGQLIEHLNVTVLIGRS